ncbi:hypothetical protein HETIRDRAFT_49626, partial [Heterobasidion irregulare TC 32-1]
EKSRDSNESLPPWKQEVRDEKGRRRLHGAFTGGFSAGYYNTVGSKEGWTPSTFTSTRGERAKQKAARPEDYMDEEDLKELEESRAAGMQEKINLLEGTPAESKRRGLVAIDPEEECADMLTSEETFGARMLKKMGWRPGQGVGPRISWKTRQDIMTQGKSDDGVNFETLEDDQEAKKHTYAPRVAVVPKFSRKDNSFGLGFVAPPNPSETLERGPEKSGPQLAVGFGLGALNEAEDDDIDIYDTPSNATRTHLAWDATDRDADEVVSVKNGPARSIKPPVSPPPKAYILPNGKPVLQGFMPAVTPVVEVKWDLLPEIPADWKPEPQRVWQNDKENQDRSSLTAEKRGSMLDGITLETGPRSVFDYMSEKDRERLQKGSQAELSIKAPTSAAAVTASPQGLPFTPPNIASAALRGFMPFTTDPVKQSRYIAYLRSQASPEFPELAPERLPGQAADAFHKEMLDYAKSAAIFKPVSGAMATRFTSAAVVDMGPRTIEGLHQPVHTSAPAQDANDREKERKEEEERREEMVEGSKAHAAKMGLYGSMTREVKLWQPSRLLCKRFGVKDPNPEVTTDAPIPGTTPATAPSASTSATGTWRPEQAMADADLQTATTSIGAIPGSSSVYGGQKRKDLGNVGLGNDEKHGRDTLKPVQPRMDIFKAIFASDDEDSENEPGENGKEIGPNGDVEKRNVESVPKVDVATFKPTFVPRSERATKKSKSKDRKDRKKKGKAILSFAGEEGEDDGLSIAPRKNHKEHKAKEEEQRRKKQRKEENDLEREEEVPLHDGEDTWVEKAAPDIVRGFESASHSHAELPSVPSESTEPDIGPPRGRKRAIDFM